MPKLHTDLEKRRAFYIYQLLRYTDTPKEELEKLNTNELQTRERNIYHDMYDSHDKYEYYPSTL